MDGRADELIMGRSVDRQVGGKEGRRDGACFNTIVKHLSFFILLYPHNSVV